MVSRTVLRFWSWYSDASSSESVSRFTKTRKRPPYKSKRKLQGHLNAYVGAYVEVKKGLAVGVSPKRKAVEVASVFFKNRKAYKLRGSPEWGLLKQ